jgi:hypothetical protein
MALPRRHPRKCLPVDLVVAAAAVAVAIEPQEHRRSVDKTTLSLQL